jgi:hypothetical protein
MHVRSISSDRLETKLGVINQTELQQLREGIRDLLHMD